MRNNTYKTVDLFGNEQVHVVQNKKFKENLFTKYDDFVDKFEIKKTTDDCYTPKEVFQVVLDYVASKTNLKNRQIFRPFYPGGNFEDIEYPDGAIVIDNPPFSIISKIVKFYLKNNIDFFLFAPHLTLFGSDYDCTYLVVGAEIVYENKACIRTSFLTNVMGNAKVVGEPLIYHQIKEINEKNKANLPVYKYPANVLTVSMVQWLIERNVGIQIDASDLVHCRGLSHQKQFKKAIFGSGFLISEKAAAEKAAAEKAAAEKAAAEKAEDKNVIVWELSKKEKEIIKNLSK
jgi:hypothetical protein